ncbi:uncharacterized protein F5147DRAFT_776125 [Suillus discolor]|uniref:DUF6535 domain-containing protein n=1 Tax=Suillus discolor TaxID=1912936 RepID=A0A9P7F3D0_9AGAM|nr:uncharacterized protein F5147DRAFT_776125 [Suillus discolor]KAG2103133.1 hypothetical protein F5147DRAFT_776125 [Suillus discolor]
MSQASGTDNDEPPPQIDAVGSIEEELNLWRSCHQGCKYLSSLMGVCATPYQNCSSNAGPSQPSGPHVQGSTPNVPPVGDLAPEGGKVVAEKDQPTLSEFIGHSPGLHDCVEDWKGQTVSFLGGVQTREEHDGEFLERYTTDMDIVLIFSGLFSAVSTTFIVAMESNLSPDPSDITNSLLKQLVQIGLGNLVERGCRRCCERVEDCSQRYA